MNKITMLDSSEQENVENMSMQEISGMGISQVPETSDEDIMDLVASLNKKTQGVTSEQEMLLREKERLEREKEEKERQRRIEEANRIRYEEEQELIRQREEEERKAEEARLEAERLKREAKLSYKIMKGLSAKKADLSDLSGVSKVFYTLKRVGIAIVVFALYNFTSIMTASFIIGRLSE